MNIWGFFVTFFEWLDISLLIIFSNQIIKTILPNSIPSNLYSACLFFILSIITFGKILGSYIFEKYIQDRKKSLLISSILLAIINLAQANLPSYEQIKIWSFIIFLILMLIKGIAIGGNYNVTIITVKSSKRYLSSSLLTLGVFAGMFCTEILQILFKTNNDMQLSELISWRIIFLISTFYSLITNITLFYINNKNLKKIKKLAFVINSISVILIILSLLFQVFNIRKILAIHLLLPFNYLFLIRKMQLKLNKSNNKKHAQENKNLKQLNQISLHNYFNVIILTLLEGLQFYYIFIFLPQYNLINNLIWLKISLIFLIPIIANIADKYNAEKILKFSCFLTILTPFLNIFSISIYIKIAYYALIFISSYSTLYGYIVIQSEKKQQEEVIGLSINLAQSILHFSIPVLSYVFQNNIKYLSIIFQITSSIVGYLSWRIIKEDHA